MSSPAQGGLLHLKLREHLLVNRRTLLGESAAAAIFLLKVLLGGVYVQTEGDVLGTRYSKSGQRVTLIEHIVN